VVSIAVPPGSSGGPSLSIWEVLIGVGIVAVGIGGVTYYVKPRPRKKRINKARARHNALCCLNLRGWDLDDIGDGHTFNPTTGQNGHWDEDKGQWIDSKTGEGLAPSVWESGPAGK
jgi:hypothetical protein